MNFDFSDEQTMLRDSLSRFLNDKYDFNARREIIRSDIGWNPQIWTQFAQMGLMGIAFPEEFEGFGGRASDMLVVMEEFGSSLVVEPYIPTVVLCGQILREVGGDIARGLISDIIAGDLIMAFAHYEPRSRFQLPYVEMTAQKNGQHYILDGKKAVVLGAPIAKKFIVSARVAGDKTDKEGLALFLVDANHSGITINGYPTIDGMKAGDLTFDKVEISENALLSKGASAFQIVERTIDRAIISLCAEAIGLCRKMCALTTEYTRTREQFGQPISKFQVLQHNMVDMFMYTEEMVSMAYMAAMRADTEINQISAPASAAKVQLGKSCKYVGETAIQLHGGMGITEEMAVGHYFMRGTMLCELFGDRDYHVKRFHSQSASEHVA